MDNNDNIIDQFKLLIKQIKFDIDFSTGKKQIINMYRLRSVQQVLKILEKFPAKITSSNQLIGIKNVGKKSLKRIDEILETGNLSEIKISSDIDKYLEIISDLEDVFGIGRKKAYELFKEHDIKSIDDLKKKFKSGKITLPPNIIKGLEYVGKIKNRIPRSEIDDLNEILTKATLEIDPHLVGVICGSYRRELSVSNDVDFIIVHSNVINQNDTLKINYLHKLILLLKNKNIIIDSLTGDDVPTKYMGIYKLNNGPLRRIDIRYVAYESFYSAILYFTGSKDFNRKMRQLAVDMGYILNEYGIYDDKNNMIHVNSEKDIFDIVGLEYLTPDKRT